MITLVSAIKYNQIFFQPENEAGDKKRVLKLLKITLGIDLHNKSLTLLSVKNSHDLDAAYSGKRNRKLRSRSIIY